LGTAHGVGDVRRRPGIGGISRVKESFRVKGRTIKGASHVGEGRGGSRGEWKGNRPGVHVRENAVRQRTGRPVRDRPKNNNTEMREREKCGGVCRADVTHWNKAATRGQGKRPKQKKIHSMQGKVRLRGGRTYAGTQAEKEGEGSTRLPKHKTQNVNWRREDHKKKTSHAFISREEGTIVKQTNEHRRRKNREENPAKGPLRLGGRFGSGKRARVCENLTMAARFLEFLSGGGAAAGVKGSKIGVECILGVRKGRKARATKKEAQKLV